jgi:hypothetical protein
METDLKSELQIDDMITVDEGSDNIVDAHDGNADDRRDMLRMGKVQELRVGEVFFCHQTPTPI